jgi:hypothetical protein
LPTLEVAVEMPILELLALVVSAEAARLVQALVEQQGLLTQAVVAEQVLEQMEAMVALALSSFDTPAQFNISLVAQ